MELPLKLLVDVSGGALRLRRWDEKKRQVSLYVDNSVGKEVGVVRFAPTSFLCLPTRMAVEKMEVCDARSVPTDFWNVSAPTAVSIHANDWVVFVHTPDRLRHYLITRGARYDRAG